MTTRERDAARARQVRKSNELIQRARFKLDVLGHKLLMFLISRIEPDDTAFREEEIPIAEICEVLDINDSGKNYQDVKEALSSLLSDSARVWVPIDDDRITTLTWIDPPIINKKTGRVTVKLNDKMRPYLLDLKANFTKFELIYTLRFRSKYSIRLYEIVKSYQYHDEQPFKKSFPVDELRALLDAENYIRFCDFNTRALKPAVMEITRFTDKNLDLREIKTGRKVREVEFTIIAKTGEALDEVRRMIAAPPRRRRQEKPIPGQMEMKLTSGDQAKLEAMRRMHEHLKGQSTATATGYTTIPGIQAEGQAL